MLTWYLHLHPVTFYGQDYEKQRKSGISYQSLSVARHVYKNYFFDLPPWIWKLERKEKKATKHWISQEQKELFRFCLEL